jgi:uncharacterized integral membrane protein
MSGVSSRRVQTRYLVRVALVVALLAILVIFIGENTLRVRVHFIFFTVTTNLIWALFVSGVLGLIIGLIAPYASRRLRR